MEVANYIVAAVVVLLIVLLVLLLSTRPSPNKSDPTNWELLFKSHHSTNSMSVRNIARELRKEGARVRIADTTSAEGMCPRDENGYRVRVSCGMEGFGEGNAPGRIVDENSLGISVPFYNSRNQ